MKTLKEIHEKVREKPGYEAVLERMIEDRLRIGATHLKIDFRRSGEPFSCDDDGPNGEIRLSIADLLDEAGCSVWSVWEGSQMLSLCATFPEKP